MSTGPGDSLDALVAALVMREKVYPLFYWDTHLGVGRVYPYATSRFRLMRSLSSLRTIPDGSTSPVYVQYYSASVDTLEETMLMLDISLRPSKNQFMWVARSGKYKVSGPSAPVAVCQVALLKVLNL